MYACIECCLRGTLQIGLSAERQQHSVMSGEWHLVWHRSHMCLYAIAQLYDCSMLKSFCFFFISRVRAVKTCPKLAVPYYGMAVCKNDDLNLFFDYSPRNGTFMESYTNDDLRITEPMPIDTDCSFKCGPGFTMTGSTMRNCLPLSKWDGIQTGCKREMQFFVASE